MKSHFGVRTLVASSVMALVASAAFAQPPAGLKLPSGFHAAIVADGLGPIRHLAVRDNGDIYVSTIGSGIIALHQDANHRADQVQHFSAVDGGTGIGFYGGALYATSSTGVYRFSFNSPGALVPVKLPEIIVAGLPGLGPGFRRANHPIAFDRNGDLFVALDDSVNDFCFKPERNPAADTSHMGVKPCPYLKDHAGIWRFSATQVGQQFPAGGQQWATGLRDMSALAWSGADDHLYGIMHGRDGLHRTFPALISTQDASQVADQMDRVTPGTNFGWPYAYYDGVRQEFLVSPGYGGKGDTVAPSGVYTTPALAFAPRSAPVSLVFYQGTNFPSAYRGGAFIALHGTRGQNGYDVVFVPWNKAGQAGSRQVFASGFAQFDHTGRPPASTRAEYRPVGLAVGPHGALYIADSQKGRIWRVSYSDN